MRDLKNKNLLVLGGRAIGSKEIVECAQKKGIKTIVVDYLPASRSIAKQLADESYDISTADIDKLAKIVKEKKVDGVFTGVHEFNIRKMINLCDETKLSCYCNEEQWDMLQNKSCFKELCRTFDIPVTKEYKIENVSELDKEINFDFPVITKPVDGSGSRGFSVCENITELRSAYERALEFSESKGVLIEQCMNYKNSVIINYTIVNGNVYFCGISDKISKKINETSGPIMSVQYYPSVNEKEYICTLDSKAKKMLESLGLQMGVVWIEAFNDHGKFVFNEMGLRFGGSLTYLPVEYFYGINQLELLIEYALTGENVNCSDINQNPNESGKVYCILPVHLREGHICDIKGVEKIEANENFIKIVPVHYVGDDIEEWGSARQVFAYLHFVADSREDADKVAKEFINQLHVYDENGYDMLYCLQFEETCS